MSAPALISRILLVRFNPVLAGSLLAIHSCSSSLMSFPDLNRTVTKFTIIPASMSDAVKNFIKDDLFCLSRHITDCSVYTILKEVGIPRSDAHASHLRYLFRW